MYEPIQKVSKPDKYRHLRLKLKPKFAKGIDLKTAYEALLTAFMRTEGQKSEDK